VAQLNWYAPHRDSANPKLRLRTPQASPVCAREAQAMLTEVHVDRRGCEVVSIACASLAQTGDAVEEYAAGASGLQISVAARTSSTGHEQDLCRQLPAATARPGEQNPDGTSFYRTAESASRNSGRFVRAGSAVNGEIEHARALGTR